MTRAFAGVAGFVLGAIAGYCVILFGWIGYTELFDVFDREGAMIMGVAFFFAPLGGIVFGIIGAIWLRRRTGRQAA